MAESFDEEEWDDFASFDTPTAAVSTADGSAEVNSAKSDPNLQPTLLNPHDAFKAAFDDEAISQGLTLSYSQTVDSPTGGVSVGNLTPNSAFVSEDSPLSAINSAHTSQVIEIHNPSGTVNPSGAPATDSSGENDGDDWNDFAGPTNDAPAPACINALPATSQLAEPEKFVGKNPVPVDLFVEMLPTDASSESAIVEPTSIVFAKVVAPATASVSDDEWDEFESHSPAPTSVPVDAADTSVAPDEVTATVESTEALMTASLAINGTAAVDTVGLPQTDVIVPTTPTAASADIVEERISATVEAAVSPLSAPTMVRELSISPSMQAPADDLDDPFADISFDQPAATVWEPTATMAAVEVEVEVPSLTEDAVPGGDTTIVEPASVDSPQTEPAVIDAFTAGTETHDAISTDDIDVSVAFTTGGSDMDIITSSASAVMSQEVTDPFAELAVELPAPVMIPVSLPTEPLEPEPLAVSSPVYAPETALVVAEEEQESEPIETEAFPVTAPTIETDGNVDESPVTPTNIPTTDDAGVTTEASNGNDAAEVVMEEVVTDAVHSVALEEVAQEEVKEEEKQQQQKEAEEERQHEEDPFAALAASAEETLPATTTDEASTTPAAVGAATADIISVIPTEAMGETPAVTVHEADSVAPADVDSVAAEEEIVSPVALPPVNTGNSDTPAAAAVVLEEPISEAEAFSTLAVTEEEADPFDTLLAAPQAVSGDISVAGDTLISERESTSVTAAVEDAPVVESATPVIPVVNPIAVEEEPVQDDGFGGFEDATELKAAEIDTEVDVSVTVPTEEASLTTEFDLSASVPVPAPAPVVAEPSVTTTPVIPLAVSNEVHEEEEEDLFGDISFQQAADIPVSPIAEPDVVEETTADTVPAGEATTEASVMVDPQMEPVLEQQNASDQQDESQTRIEEVVTDIVEEAKVEPEVEAEGQQSGEAHEIEEDEEDEWDDFEGPATVVTTTTTTAAATTTTAPATTTAAAAASFPTTANDVDNNADIVDTFAEGAPIVTFTADAESTPPAVTSGDVTPSGNEVVLNEVVLNETEENFSTFTAFSAGPVVNVTPVAEVSNNNNNNNNNTVEEEEEEWDAFEGPATATSTATAISDPVSAGAGTAEVVVPVAIDAGSSFAAFETSAVPSVAVVNTSFEATFDDNADAFGSSSSGANDDDEWAAFEDHSSTTNNNNNITTSVGTFEANFDAPAAATTVNTANTASTTAVAATATEVDDGFAAFDEAPAIIGTSSAKDSNSAANNSFAAFGTTADSFSATFTAPAAPAAIKAAIPASTNSADFYSPATLQTLNSSSGGSDMPFIAALPGLQFTEDQRQAYDTVSALSASLFTTSSTNSNSGSNDVLSGLAQRNSLHQPLAQFNLDLTSILAPVSATIATEAPAVRLESTLHSMLTEAVPADALSLEQLALLLEALVLRSATGKKQAVTAAAVASSSAAHGIKPPLASRSTSSSGDRKRQGSDASAVAKPSTNTTSNTTSASAATSEPSATSSSSSPLDYLFGRKSTTTTTTAATATAANAATTAANAASNGNSSRGNVSPTPTASSPVQRKSSFLSLTAALSAATSTASLNSNSGLSNGTGPTVSASGGAQPAGPSSAAATNNTATSSNSPPAIVARLAKQRSLDASYFGDNTTDVNLTPTALDFINSLPDLAYLLH